MAYVTGMLVLVFVHVPLKYLADNESLAFVAVAHGWLHLLYLLAAGVPPAMAGVAHGPVPAGPHSAVRLVRGDEVGRLGYPVDVPACRRGRVVRYDVTMTSFSASPGHGTAVLLAADSGGGGLIIDWTRFPVYNTIMSVAAGAALLLVVALGRQLVREPREVSVDGYAVAFGALGFILTTTGLHMTLTWPLAPYFPYTNIIFGETSLGLGVLLLTGSFYLWRRGALLQEVHDPLRTFANGLGPLSVFVFGLGLSLFAIAAAGLRYQLFVAPPEEPITGQFADYPWVESIFISGLFALVGLGAVLFPFVLRARGGGGAAKVMGIAWGLSGAAFLVFGALNYFTHIGLIINTM